MRLLVLALTVVSPLASAELTFHPPTTITYRGYEVHLSPQQFGVVALVAGSADDFVSFAAIHRWAGWKTKPNAPRVRTLIKMINLRAYDQAGAPVLVEPSAGERVTLARPPAPVAEADYPAHVAAVLTHLGETAGELRIDEAQYRALGLPKAEILRLLPGLPGARQVQSVRFEVLEYSSRSVLGSTRRSDWFSQKSCPNRLRR